MSLARFANGPQPTETLLARMVCFLFTYREPAERFARRHRFGVSDILATYYEDAARLWDRLVADQPAS